MAKSTYEELKDQLRVANERTDAVSEELATAKGHLKNVLQVLKAREMLLSPYEPHTSENVITDCAISLTNIYCVVHPNGHQRASEDLPEPDGRQPTVRICMAVSGRRRLLYQDRNSPQVQRHTSRWRALARRSSTILRSSHCPISTRTKWCSIRYRKGICVRYEGI